MKMDQRTRLTGLEECKCMKPNIFGVLHSIGAQEKSKSEKQRKQDTRG